MMKSVGTFEGAARWCPARVADYVFVSVSPCDLGIQLF